VTVGITNDRTQPGSGATGGGKAIDEASSYVGHAGSFVEGEQLEARSVRVGEPVDRDRATSAVLQDVRRQFGGDECDSCLDLLTKSVLARKPRR